MFYLQTTVKKLGNLVIFLIVAALSSVIYLGATVWYLVTQGPSSLADVYSIYIDAIKEQWALMADDVE
jgi:hypothetical protein